MVTQAQDFSYPVWSNETIYLIRKLLKDAERWQILIKMFFSDSSVAHITEKWQTLQEEWFFITVPVLLSKEVTVTWFRTRANDQGYTYGYFTMTDYLICNKLYLFIFIQITILAITFSHVHVLSWIECSGRFDCLRLTCGLLFAIVLESSVLSLLFLSQK